MISWQLQLLVLQLPLVERLSVRVHSGVAWAKPPAMVERTTTARLAEKVQEPALNQHRIGLVECWFVVQIGNFVAFDH